MEGTSYHTTTNLQYAPENDARKIDGIIEYSISSISIHDHGMPDRLHIKSVGSFDPSDSFATAFSLVPRMSSPMEFRTFAPAIKKVHHPKETVLHPQVQGRPVVALDLELIPDQLKIPML